MVEWCMACPELSRRKRIGRGLRHMTALGLTLVLGLLLLPSLAWGTTQVGNAELQLWYRMRHTFQTDSGDHFDWVQWRNEVFGWLVYDPLVEDGRLFGQIELPFVKFATLNARYRFRFDPVYMIRDHFENIYDGDERDSFIIPENGFRDLFVDLEFDQVGPGRLSARIGNQQIIWGEADLFRSLDAINPLHIDQTTGVGEKIDELRAPIFAIKFLYDIGTVGTWFSDIAFESWYSPRYRTTHEKLIVEQGWRLPFHMKGCWKDGRMVPYSVENCKDSRQFLPFRPEWLPWRRTRHPWSLARVGSQLLKDSPSVGCVAGTLCRSDVFGERTSAVINLSKGEHRHHLRGWDRHAGGVRILGRTFFNLDFTLNYMYIYNVYGSVDTPSLFFDTWGNLRPDIIYGDFGLIPGVPPAGDFATGLRRCLSRTGKTNDGSSRLNPKEATILTGADLQGFDWPERLLDANGNPLPGAQPHAARLPLTICTRGIHQQLGTNVVGFTLTYNDFEYTGAVFRAEQSVSTKEGLNVFPPGSPNPRIINGKPAGPAFEAPFSEFANKSFKNRLLKTTWAWRGMLAMDLLKAYSNYWLLRWTRNLPGEFGTNQAFLTAQWFWTYYGQAIGNSLWNATGSTGRPGQRGHRHYRWNHLLTLGTGGYGFFKGRLEQRAAVVFEPRAQQTLLYGEWWWRNLLGFRELEVSFGVSWKPSSGNDDSWTLLNFYTDRDLLWAQFTYYLL